MTRQRISDNASRPKPSDSRDRFLTAATMLFRRQGYNGTGLKQLVEQGRAPVGSFYHFFPGGKLELSLAAIDRTRERYEALLDRVFRQTEDTAAAAIEWFAMAARALEESDFADGCPIGTVACEVASTHDEIRVASAAVFASWRARVAAQLVDEGVAALRARQLAMFAVAALEGAILLARNERDVAPLRDTGEVVGDVLRTAVGSAGGA
jgi:TetR/AcrR family transcriptional repressor of lmrAB and yxaGH operons